MDEPRTPGAPAPMLVLRADATEGVGAGHVMRCSTLAAAWTASGGGACLWGRVEIPFVMTRIAELGLPVTDQPPAGQVLVVDSYDEALRRSLGAEAVYDLRVLADDLGGAVPPGFEVVWNPNPGALASLYPEFAGTTLAGARYAAVRASLPTWRSGRRGAADAIGVLIGGAPAPALVDALRAATARLPGRRFLGAGPWIPSGWERVDAADVWRHVSGADVLVTAAGTTMLEAASVGIPVVVLQVAENQRENAAWARTAGVPVLDARTAADLRALPDRLTRAIGAARPLPPLRDGTPRLARELHELLGRVRA